VQLITEGIMQAANTPDVAEQEEQAEQAAEILSTFCSTYAATRIKPNPDELLTLWQRCTSLSDTAIADAFVQQLMGMSGFFEWQPCLRALYALEYFAAHGGSGRKAAMAALDETKDLLHYLIAEVAQCRKQAAVMLALLPGQESSEMSLVSQEREAELQLSYEPAIPTREIKQHTIVSEEASQAALIVLDKASLEAGSELCTEGKPVSSAASTAASLSTSSDAEDWSWELNWQQGAAAAQVDPFTKGEFQDKAVVDTTIFSLDDQFAFGERQGKHDSEEQQVEGAKQENQDLVSRDSDVGHHWLNYAVDAIDLPVAADPFAQLRLDLERMKGSLSNLA